MVQVSGKDQRDPKHRQEITDPVPLAPLPGLGPQVADPSMRGTIMALRYDPDASALMAGALAQDNRAALTPVLGRDPEPAELYLAHFLGAAGAGKFLSAMSSDPTAAAASLLPAAAAANRSIFYAPGGAPRSLGGVMDLIRDKLGNAMGDQPDSPYPTSAAGSFAMAQTGWQASATRPPAAPAMPSAHLRSPGPTAVHVRDPADQLRARRPARNVR